MVTLSDKFNNSGVHGYLTDEELLRFREMAAQAIQLAKEFDAGHAVISYYTTWFSQLSYMCYARGLPIAAVHGLG